MSSVKVFDPSLEKIVEEKSTLSIFPVRDDEPEYAKLKDTSSQESNRYGNAIPLVPLEETVSLKINGVDAIGPNPNRNKQHAFHFNADNCIGCHACESACSEKNNLPPHLSFRSVGYVEGGTYPNYQRMNISMACNHCDDPVCLKGCPTRAYTKHEEYGAVIQDPDICFGCGYCTWVCPYNAPQLDPVAGQVEKCNMCVDRLEVGLKPACVSACVGNALDFGVVENIPDRREQIETSIPGFPTADITQPNIRFQQKRTLPKEVTRTDSAPVKYTKNENAKRYTPSVDQKTGTAKQWNLKKLSSRENPLVIFTLSTQTAIGLFWLLFLGNAFNIGPLASLSQSAMYVPAIFSTCALTALGLFMSTIHLGKPLRFYRGFNNLRHSPVCREGLGILLFMVFGGLHMLSSLPANSMVQSVLTISPTVSQWSEYLATTTGWLASLAASAGLYYMYRCYRIKARPFWDHWQSGSAFLGSAFSLGAIVCGLIFIPAMLLSNAPVSPLVIILAPVVVVGLTLEAVGLMVHARAMTYGQHEGAASHYTQCSDFGKTYFTRNLLMALNVLAIGLLSFGLYSGLVTESASLIMLGLTACSIVMTAVIGRALFYVLVVPTTMPGAFFWKNKAFEEHARETGLADLPQTGVVSCSH